MVLIILTLLAASFLRLFRLPEFVTFLGDQGRDAIIIKRIITLEDFPAIGAPSSVGSVFLGPFYYYLISPFLLLFRFDPTGLAYGVAILSIIGIILSYVIVRKFTDDLTALLFTCFISFSSVLIDLSRFSWNPNLLPVFSFLTLFFFYLAFYKGKTRYSFLFGSFLALSLQLHHLAGLILFSALAVVMIEKQYKPFNIFFKKLGLATAGFILFNAPLILFDLKHNFLNARSLFELFTQKNIVSGTSSSYLGRLNETVSAFLNHITQLFVIPHMAVSICFFLFLFFLLYKYRKQKFIFLHTINMLVFIIGFSALTSFRHPHYYGAIYYSFFTIFSYFLTTLSKHKMYIYTIALAVMVLFFISNSKKYTYLYSYGSEQVKRARTIASSISEHVTAFPFQLASIPSTETDGHIRYFLELDNKRPLRDDSSEEPTQLIVLCYEKNCQVVANPQWQIAAFKRAKIDTIWSAEKVSIYKLVHEK